MNMLDLLAEVEQKFGHDMWAEITGRPDRQHWDCRGCGAALERWFADGTVTGLGALREDCPKPRPRQRRVGRITVLPPATGVAARQGPRRGRRAVGALGAGRRSRGGPGTGREGR